MEYIFNTFMDAFGIFLGVISIIGLVAGTISAVFWIIQKVDEIHFNRQMAAETIKQNAISTDVGRVKLETERANVALVQLDPTRPILPRLQLESGEFSPQMLLLAAKYLEAWGPVANVPNSLTYSPHIVNKSEGKQLEQDDQKLLPAVKILDFGELYNQRLLPKNEFLLGASLEDGQFVNATWRQMYSTLIVGQSGSGKSTLVRNLLAQAALQGSKFLVIDPHYGAGDESLGESLKPLSNLMLTDVAANEPQIIATLKNIRDIGQRRLAGQDTDKTPVVLVVDETTALLQRGNVRDLLLEVLGFISQETRKVCVYAICLGQIFTAEIFPSEVRNAFVNFIATRTRKDNARCATGNGRFAAIAENLTIGQAVRMTPAGEVQTLAVPNCTMAHLEMVAGENGTFYALEGTSASVGEGENSEAEGAWKDTGRTLEGVSEGQNSATNQRIVQLFCSGESLHSIVKDVYKIEGGRRYNQAVESVQDVIRNYMNGLGGK